MRCGASGVAGWCDIVRVVVDWSEAVPNAIDVSRKHAGGCIAAFVIEVERCGVLIGRHLVNIAGGTIFTLAFVLGFGVDRRPVVVIVVMVVVVGHMVVFVVVIVVVYGGRTGPGARDRGAC